MKGGLARWRVRAGYPAALLYFWLAHPRPEWILAGAATGILGLGFRGCAAGYLRKNQGLATSGPYAWTRNPLYFGSMWLAAGLAVAANSWIAATVVAVYFLAFYPATMRSEETELAARYGAAYREYSASTPLFWPRPPRGRALEGKFSWAVYRANHEYNAGLGLAVVVALLVLKMIWLG